MKPFKLDPRDFGDWTAKIVDVQNKNSRASGEPFFVVVWEAEAPHGTRQWHDYYRDSMFVSNPKYRSLLAARVRALWAFTRSPATSDGGLVGRTGRISVREVKVQSPEQSYYAVQVLPQRQTAPEFRSRINALPHAPVMFDAEEDDMPGAGAFTAEETEQALRALAARDSLIKDLVQALAEAESELAGGGG